MDFESSGDGDELAGIESIPSVSAIGSGTLTDNDYACKTLLNKAGSFMDYAHRIAFRR